MRARDTRIQTKRRRAQGYEKMFARLGKEDGTLRDVETNSYWARPISNTGALGAATTFRRLPGRHFRVSEGILVELQYSQSRELMIAGEAEDEVGDAALDTFLGNIGDPASAGLLRTEQLGNLLCRKSPAEAWVAQVLPGCTIMGTTYVELTIKTEIDLTGEVPSAGNHCYVAVFLKDDGTLTSTNSTPQANTSPLNSTDIQECISALGAGNWLALRAFVFDGDEDDFSDSPDTAKDLRAPFSVVL